MSSVFKFKQFTIDQTNSPFKVGTDGVLAGALCTLNNTKKILDIGTGTGLITLMLAQRSNATIDAIEINETAFNQAKLNFENSPWKDRLTIHHCSLLGFKPKKKYDVIISNPPYFQNSLKSNSESKNTARHFDSLTPAELVKFSIPLLSNFGKLCIIYPIEEGKQVIEFAQESGLYCSRIVNIKPTPEKESKRLFLEFQLTEIEPKIEELIIEQNGRHQYSDDYLELTKEFYLAF